MITESSIKYLEYGDRIKTLSGFIIEINEYTEITKDDDKVVIIMEKDTAYGTLRICDEVIATFRRTCKLKRKK